MSRRIPVIDIFAGPGGLGEGFASLRGRRGSQRFELRLSIEKDPWAVQTLRLRALQRRIGSDDKGFLELIRSGVTPERIESLLTRYRRRGEDARAEVWHQTLGPSHAQTVRGHVAQRLHDAQDWVLIGGPPCQAYSLAGRSRNRAVHGYVPEEDERQTLYVEYLQIIADHVPTVFVMENVKGLLSASLSSQRLFERILADLHDPAAAVRKMGRSTKGRRRPRYRVVPVATRETSDLFDSGGGGSPRDYVVRAEEFGVPQARHRVILLGLLEGAVPYPERGLVRTAPPTVDEVIGDLPHIRSGLTDRPDTAAEWVALLSSSLRATWLKQSPEGVKRRIRQVVTGLRVPESERGAEVLPHESGSTVVAEFGRAIPGVICNHSSRAHMGSDLHRYLFAASYGRELGRSPTLADFPAPLRPDHRNVKKALNGGHFSDRFRVQVGNRPATTVTSHISKDGHYYVHPDPEQCRSLTVREAARLQTFPDDYFFVGPRTAQYHQVGNAVPPHLARQIASLVADLLC